MFGMSPLSVAEAHETTGIPRRTITHAINQGWLKASRLGAGAWMINPDDLEQWVTSRDTP